MYKRCTMSDCYNGYMVNSNNIRIIDQNFISLQLSTIYNACGSYHGYLNYLVVEAPVVGLGQVRDQYPHSIDPLRELVHRDIRMAGQYYLNERSWYIYNIDQLISIPTELIQSGSFSIRTTSVPLIKKEQEGDLKK